MTELYRMVCRLILPYDCWKFSFASRWGDGTNSFSYNETCNNVLWVHTEWTIPGPSKWHLGQGVNISLLKRNSFHCICSLNYTRCQPCKVIALAIPQGYCGKYQGATPPFMILLSYSTYFTTMIILRQVYGEMELLLTYSIPTRLLPSLYLLV